MSILVSVDESLSPSRRVWRLALPMIIANLSVPLLGVVDTAAMGHLDSPHYIGAVAAGSLILSFVYWGFSFLRMGTTAFAAQALGAGRRDEIWAVLIRGLALALVLAGAILAVQGLLTSVAVALLEASPAVEQGARLYVSIRIWSAPATLTFFVMLGWLRGTQRAGATCPATDAQSAQRRFMRLIRRRIRVGNCRGGAGDVIGRIRDRSRGRGPGGARGRRHNGSRTCGISVRRSRRGAHPAPQCVSSDARGQSGYSDPDVFPDRRLRLVHGAWRAPGRCYARGQCLASQFPNIDGSGAGRIRVGCGSARWRSARCSRSGPADRVGSRRRPRCADLRLRVIGYLSGRGTLYHRPTDRPNRSPVYGARTFFLARAVADSIGLVFHVGWNFHRRHEDRGHAQCDGSVPGGLRCSYLCHDANMGQSRSLGCFLGLSCRAGHHARSALSGITAGYSCSGAPSRRKPSLPELRNRNGGRIAPAAAITHSLGVKKRACDCRGKE